MRVPLERRRGLRLLAVAQRLSDSSSRDQRRRGAAPSGKPRRSSAARSRCSVARHRRARATGRSAIRSPPPIGRRGACQSAASRRRIARCRAEQQAVDRRLACRARRRAPARDAAAGSAAQHQPLALRLGEPQPRRRSPSATRGIARQQRGEAAQRRRARSPPPRSAATSARQPARVRRSRAAPARRCRLPASPPPSAPDRRRRAA